MAFQQPPGECTLSCYRQVTVTTVVQGPASPGPSLPRVTLGEASSLPCLRNRRSRGQRPSPGELEQGKRALPPVGTAGDGQHQEARVVHGHQATLSLSLRVMVMAVEMP